MGGAGGRGGEEGGRVNSHYLMLSRCWKHGGLRVFFLFPSSVFVPACCCRVVCIVLFVCVLSLDIPGRVDVYNFTLIHLPALRTPLTLARLFLGGMLPILSYSRADVSGLPHYLLAVVHVMLSRVRSV